jgi:hypothetical protein
VPFQVELLEQELAINQVGELVIETHLLKDSGWHKDILL